jgi:hypothetical protein
MAKLPDIMRVVAVEHKGEKIQFEIHIHLSQEEIRNILVPAVVDAIGAQARRSMNVRPVLASGTVMDLPPLIERAEVDET